MKFEGTKDYVATDDLTIAVNAAVTLERPLLVKGEPGTGKTELARQVASALGLPMIEWNIKSTTRAHQIKREPCWFPQLAKMPMPSSRTVCSTAAWPDPGSSGHVAPQARLYRNDFTCLMKFELAAARTETLDSGSACSVAALVRNDVCGFLSGLREPGGLPEIKGFDADQPRASSTAAAPDLVASPGPLLPRPGT